MVHFLNYHNAAGEKVGNYESSTFENKWDILVFQTKNRLYQFLCSNKPLIGVKRSKMLHKFWKYSTMMRDL